MSIHFGETLKNYFKLKRIYKSALARKMNTSIANILYYEKKPSIQLHNVEKLCHALQHNFFMDIAATLPANYTTSVAPNTALELKIMEQESLIFQLQTENNLMKTLLNKKL
jgi:transcriptional regulator with XRE-family HTH domain